MKNIFIVILFLFAISNAFALDHGDTVNDLIKTTHDLTLNDRIVAISDKLLNTPYVLEPLGEGRHGEFNQKPLYRFDAFDCETLVDTVIALSLANTLQQFQWLMTHIRYKNGEVAFSQRNHFTSADWLPNNAKQGFIEDITQTIADTTIEKSTVFINRRNWYKHLPASRIYIQHSALFENKLKLQQLHQLSSLAKNTEATIDYIPLTKLLDSNNTKLIAKIPNGSLIFLVENNPILVKKIGTALNISHMGFAVWRDNTLYLRAASLPAHRVIDVPLIKYLSLYLPYGKLLGISVWRVAIPQPPSYAQ